MLTRYPSKDGSTKFGYDLPEGGFVECFFVKLKYMDSMCISSQIGCALDCKFCVTGLTGLERSISSNEILLQVDAIVKELGWPDRDFEVSFMGMGEPLLNYDAVTRAIGLIAAKYSPKQFRLSTVGIVPRIHQLAHEHPEVVLQLSLHAPFDDIRSRIMPINRKFPIKNIIDAIRYHSEVTGGTVFINYMLLEGVNDSIECAHELARIISTVPCRLKISSYNETALLPLRSALAEKYAMFEEICQGKCLQVYQHKNSGTDVFGGCGLLRSYSVNVIEEPRP